MLMEMSLASVARASPKLTPHDPISIAADELGGIAEEEFSSFDASRILVWPISYEGTVSYGGGTGEAPRPSSTPRAIWNSTTKRPTPRFTSWEFIRSMNRHRSIRPSA